MKKNSRLLWAALIALLCGVLPAYAGAEHGHTHGSGQEHHEEEAHRGPQGGRLFSKGRFGLELVLFEKESPPRFRAYIYENGRPVVPGAAEVTITLTRIGGRKEKLRLKSQGNYLTSEKGVAEPHSFEVKVEAAYAGESYAWDFASYEGRVELSPEALRIANIRIETAGPAHIATIARVYGRLLPNADKVAHVVPRFPGVIKEIKKSLGDSVAKSEVLAIIESNQGLQDYEIRSSVAGVVVKRHAAPGEFVTSDRELLVVADLSDVWADFQVYRDDFGPIEAGQQIFVDLGDGREIPATVTYVSPLVDEVTQSRLIRAVLPNTGGDLRPGLFVSGVLSSAEAGVPVAVRREAIQTFRDWNVVYLTDGRVFQAVPVELGRKDRTFAEIVSGLAPGDRYVAGNSFIIKAEIEKSAASHDH